MGASMWPTFQTPMPGSVSHRYRSQFLFHVAPRDVSPRASGEAASTWRDFIQEPLNELIGTVR